MGAPPRPHHHRPREHTYENIDLNISNLRRTLLNLELQDHTLQRRLIEPSKYFSEGFSSIGDNDLVCMEKVKLYFPLAFGGRKFTGKKGSDIGIVELL